MAIVTGEVSLIYAVVAGEKPIYVLFLAVLGALALLLVSLKMVEIDKELNIILDEIEELED